MSEPYISLDYEVMEGIAANKIPDNLGNSYYMESGFVETYGMGIKLLKEEVRDKISTFLAEILKDKENFRKFGN